MSATLAGTWKLEKSENFDDFLKEMGVNFVIRKLAATAKPTVILQDNNDGSWTMVRKGGPKEEPPLTFKDNVEFDEKTPNGDQLKSVVRIESPKKQTHTSQGPKGKVFSTRELIDDKMVMTMVAPDGKTTCKRVFTRSEK